jgi:archaellum biogenesis protein FlaJ (TadC family)
LSLRRRLFRGSGEEIGPEAGMLYIATLAAFNADDNAFLSAAAETEGPLARHVATLRRAVRLVRGWSYPLAAALSAAARGERVGGQRELVERMAQAVNVGMSVTSLVSAEYEKMREHAQINHERAMERLKTMGDVLSTVLSSASFLLISFTIVSMVFTGISPAAVLALILGGLSAGLGGIVYYIYRLGGRDSLINPSPYLPALLRASNSAAPLILTGSAGAALLSAALLPLPAARLALIAAPIICVAASVYPVFALRRVQLLDDHLPFFMKSLCETVSLVNVPERVVEVLRIGAQGPIKRHVERLYLRVKSRVDFYLGLRMMAGESCSGLLYEAVEIMVEAVRRGVPAGQLGKKLYDYLADRLVMRRRRRQVSSYIRGILFPTIVAVSAIMGLMDSLYVLLASYSSLAASILPLSPAVEPEAVSRASMTVVVIMSLAGGLALHFCERRSAVHLCLTFGLILLSSAGAYYAVNAGTYTILESMTRYAVSLREMVPA